MVSPYDLRDHTASDGSLRIQFKGADYKPSWALFLSYQSQGLVDITERVVSATVTNDPEGMAMKFTVTGRLMGWEGYHAGLYARYGPGERQTVCFAEITNIKDSSYGTYSEVEAYGTSRIRGKQVLERARDFSGLTLRQAMDYIGGNSVTVDTYAMEGGEEYTLRDPEAEGDTSSQPSAAQFMAEASWLEVERALLEPTNYVGFDTPKGHFIMKRPEIRHGGDPVNYKTWWEPVPFPAEWIPKGGFQFTPGTREIYQKVIVFRRRADHEPFPAGTPAPGFPVLLDEDYEVYAENDIDRTGLLPAWSRTDYIVPDFNGTQAEAEIEAHRLAFALRTVTGTFELDIPWINFWPYDVFYAERIEERPADRTAFVTGVPVPTGSHTHVKATYTCIIDGSIEQTVGRQVFRVKASGSAALRSLEAIANPAQATYGSTGLVPIPA